MLLSHSTPEALAKALCDLQLQSDEWGVIFIGEENAPPLENIWQALEETGLPFVGGIFPAILSGREVKKEGAVVWKVPLLSAPFRVEGLNGTDFQLPENLESTVLSKGKSTLLVLVDGLTSNIALFLRRLYDVLGPQVHYIGGGAGSLTLQQKPCLFQKGTPPFQDGALLLPLARSSSLGVRHGWKPLMGPVVATKTQKNVICQLNWRGAFEVYREVVEKDAGVTLTQENFFDIAKGYPFGIVKEGQEEIVRDPIQVTDAGELVCVGEVPENAVLMILKGTEESLVSGAEQAAKDCAQDTSVPPSEGVVFDCISRVLFLGDAFPKEAGKVLDEFSQENLYPEGALTLGEIASYGDGFLEFFNKTIVVAKLYPLLEEA